MKKERLHLATPGWVYFLTDRALVDKLLATGNFSIIKTHFTNECKKWWEFWKIKRPISYEVMCNKDLEV